MTSSSWSRAAQGDRYPGAASVICYLPDTTDASGAALEAALGIATRRLYAGRYARVVAVHVPRFCFLPTDTEDVSGTHLVLQAAAEVRAAVENRVGQARRASDFPVVSVSNRGSVGAALARQTTWWGGDVIVLPAVGSARSRHRLAVRLHRVTGAVVLQQPAGVWAAAAWTDTTDSS